jgi:hypothetical protein
MAISCWIIGSVKDLAAQTLTVQGGAQVITAGSRYLYSDSAGLSMLRAVQDALAGAGLVGVGAVLLRNRKVRLSANSNFSVVWPADNVLRNLLGFTGNLAGASTYTAANVSPLLFSPGRTESPQMAPLGVVGHKVLTTYHAISPLDGSASSVTHGSTGRRYNQFVFNNVPAARYQTADENGGEWVVFFETVCAPAYSFHLWRLVEESDASTSVATLTTSLGPYVLTPERRAVDWKFGRSGGSGWTDANHPLTMTVHQVPEYGA